jgi:hypothetical protein
MLEIEEQGQAAPGGFQVIQGLSQLLVAQLIDAFNFDDELVVHNQVGKVFSDAVPFVGYGDRDLGANGYATAG